LLVVIFDVYEIELKQIVAPKVETPLDPTGLANQKRTIIYAAGREIWPARVPFEKNDKYFDKENTAVFTMPVAEWIARVSHGWHVAITYWSFFILSFVPRNVPELRVWYIKKFEEVLFTYGYVFANITNIFDLAQCLCIYQFSQIRYIIYVYISRKISCNFWALVSSLC
jgi:hypothetical protein